MITVRRGNERGHADHGWLDTYHSFSFADYYDPKNMGFRALRVINDDRVAGGMGFDMHPHRDMEILTYVLEGQLEHSDSMGNGAVIHPGEVQVMTAGTGVMHSEFNPSVNEPVHLMQIWIKPERHGLKPSYAQKMFNPEGRHGKLQIIAAHEPRDGALKINQDANVYVAVLEKDKPVDYTLAPGRHAWLQVLTGKVKLNDLELNEGDGVAISDEQKFSFEGNPRGEIMFFDLA
jgi:quercetin 2,3-dioxygenase